MSATSRTLKILGTLVVLGLLLSIASSSALARQNAASQPWSQSGWFSVVWGDEMGGASHTYYRLTGADGRITELALNETLLQSLGGTLALNHKYVTVQGALAAPDGRGWPVVNVTSMNFASPPRGSSSGAPMGVSGSYPWVSIMCKFSDVATEPNNQAYFAAMYTTVPHGLDDYWREVSYNIVNVVGSAASGWFNLPNAVVYYNPTLAPKGTNLGLLANECIAAADPSVDFSLYQGINMMFNTDFDFGWAWGGGGWTGTLDGVTKTWSTTWEPPWSYADISVIEHEMGHGFGLPHSSLVPATVYDNAWDVMSWDRYNCAASTDATYGCMAQHTIADYKDMLAWIGGGLKTTVVLGTTNTITMERLALPATGNFLLAKVPIGGSATHYYTVEVREQVGYDIKLAGNAVVIHDVDTTRDPRAILIDADGNNFSADAGAMWIVGETFTDAVNNILITVDSATATGFVVTIQNGNPDTTPPVLSLPSNMTVEATGPSGRVVTFTATATDETAPPNPTVTCVPASGSTFPIGTTTVNCSATDAAGNPANGSFTITVQDTTPPSVTVPANMTLEATGPSGRVVAFTASASDAVGLASFACVPASGSTFPLGTTTVTCTAVDTTGNSGSASFTITIQDTTPPVVTVPANMIVEATGPTGAVATYVATASDTVGIATFACTPPSGSTFPLGITTVTCTAVDTSGNSASASFTITVQDTTPPTLTLPANITVPQLTPLGTVVSFAATATDLVAPPNPVVTCIPASGFTFPVGTTTVNCSASDAAGNVAHGSFTVTVNPSVNLLLNPGYDNFITAPKAWYYSVVNIPLSSLKDCAIFNLSPSCSLKLLASKTTRVVTQTITHNGFGGDQFSYGHFSAAQNVPAGGTYKVEIALFNRFNRVMYTQTLWFTDGTHGFELVNDQFIAPAAFNKMRFRIYFQKIAGIAWFDDAFLYFLP